MTNSFSRLHLAARWILAIACVPLSLFLFLIPGVKLVGYLRDPALKDGRIPAAAWELSRTLAPRYASWAKERVARENEPSTVSGTEWPLFGSVFYLEAIDSMQDAWLRDASLSPVAPAVYSKEAISAAANLIVQPSQAKWVQSYWGKEYLHHEDLFYRYLLISGMTAYTHLTGDGKYIEPLRDQVESLSSEIDSSPRGFLNDYPGQCYPPDIISALASIKRADVVLHTNHDAMLQRALRAFTPPFVDDHGLPPFCVMAITGTALEPSRGSGDSFNLAAAPQIWPAQSKEWYEAYTEQFWQERKGLVGFREFAKDVPAKAEFADVDSGPVIWGYGVAASAFGVAATRAQGDLARAAPLTAEMLAASWPLAGGTLLMPRLLSDGIDAPFVGESGILFCLTRTVPAGAAPGTMTMTPFVWWILAVQFEFGTFSLLPLAMLLRERAGLKARRDIRLA
jgi:hypothetical protein